MRLTNRLRTLLRGLWVALLVVVVVTSLSAATPAIRLPDKPLHFVSYAWLAVLPALHERRRTLLFQIAFVLALGVALEFGQLLVRNRSFEVADMAANAMGVCAGLVAGLVLRAAFRRRGQAGPSSDVSGSKSETALLPGTSAFRQNQG